MQTIVNFSNHPLASWSEEQRAEACRLAGTDMFKDIAFPMVSPQMTSEEIRQMAESYVAEVLSLSPALVMCQGEFTLCYNIVRLLKEAGVKVVAACSNRMVTETPDGKKIVTFKFECFREY